LRGTKQSKLQTAFFVAETFQNINKKPPAKNGRLFVSDSETTTAVISCNFDLYYLNTVMSDIIVNKVAESGLITFDLEEFYPKGHIAVFDLKDYLFMGLILKEKDYRAALLATDWTQYQDKYVAITCTADAIIPIWANMLAASYLQPVAKDVVFGNEQQLITNVLTKNLAVVKGEEYTDKRVVVKGCGDIAIPETAYVDITNKLRPFAKSIMYGEPCSTVPIYKKR
jgi:hypothetical protein